MFLFLLGSSFFLCMQKVPWCKKKGMKIQDIALILTQEKCWQFFYHSQNHRRLYITVPIEAVQGWNIGSSKLYGVDCPRAVVAMLQGRAFDRFKRSFDLVKKLSDDCYLLPPLFWVRFAYLAKNGKNSLNNIERLIKLFGGTSAL